VKKTKVIPQIINNINNEEINKKFELNPNWSIMMPVINSIIIAGMTIKEIRLI
tara:strand:+ start:2064 stop:2222 length:159 start_codon:yes stop_codon:yes gene_type:complete